MQGQVEFLDFISNEKFKFKYKFKSKQRHSELCIPGFSFFRGGGGGKGLLEQGIIEFKTLKNLKILLCGIFTIMSYFNPFVSVLHKIITVQAHFFRFMLGNCFHI